MSKTTTFNCEYCGTEKTVFSAHYKAAEHHYCSVKCKGLAKRVDTSIIPMIDNCQRCGNEMIEKDRLILSNYTCSTLCKSCREIRDNKNHLAKNLKRAEFVKKFNSMFGGKK